jgi:hypothetical protein
MDSAIAPVTITKYRERYMKCASCRSDARFMIWGGYGINRTTTCQRHLKVWVLRYKDPKELEKWQSLKK